MVDLSHARLKKLLRYDPETGCWTRLVTSGGRPAGSQAGYLKKEARSLGLYRYIGFGGTYHVSSRLAFFYMTGRWPQHQIDHRDLDTTNDRWSNLREATGSQNQANKSLQRNNSTGFRGVNIRGRDGSVWASIRRDGKRKYLGTFETINDAHSAYMREALATDGEFARSA